MYIHDTCSHHTHTSTVRHRRDILLGSGLQDESSGRGSCQHTLRGSIHRANVRQLLLTGEQTSNPGLQNTTLFSTSIFSISQKLLHGMRNTGRAHFYVIGHKAASIYMMFQFLATQTHHCISWTMTKCPSKGLHTL